MNTGERSILTQILGVSQRDYQGSRGLVYAPVRLIEEGVMPEPHYRPVNIDVLRRQIENIRGRVEELIWRARLGQERENCGIETEAEALASHILPECGFAGIIEPGINPQFDITYDIVSEIPWEVLEQHYAVCKCCPDVFPVRRETDAETPTFCQVCGKKMEHGGGKLVIDRHLTHLVRGGRLPTGNGNEFLIIEDPTEDLCSAEVDPTRECADHLRKLKSILEQHGYLLNVIRKKNATTRRVLSALGNPAVVGLYYFGHGYFPRSGDQGCLLLADGPLYASEIEDLGPDIRFIFLNACESGSAGHVWTLEKKFRSVGHAFARGGPTKTVIAPLWPVVNVQAARTALDFFRNLSESVTLGEAMRQSRLSSLDRYRRGAPDISWMAYRYFGDPNRGLPAPVDEEKTVVGVSAPLVHRVFGDNDYFDTDSFAFDVRSVLLRAAKRRNLQSRALLTAADFLAGLVRTGHLTRFAFRQHETDPDTFYKQIVTEIEEGPPASDPVSLDEITSEITEDDAKSDEDSKQEAATRLHRLLAQWIVRKKHLFQGDILAILDRADEIAQTRTTQSENRRISEQDVLDAFTHADNWDVSTKASLPPASRIRQWLIGGEGRRAVNENGCLVLDSLDAAARRIVETAHELAQQRGVGSVPNRLLLAAFLNQPAGYVAKLCRQFHVRAKALGLVLVAATESKPPESFVLSPESGRRVVLPMLVRARQHQLAVGSSKITEPILFKAYCDVAPPQFRQLLKTLPESIRADLDALKAATVPLPSQAAVKPIEPVEKSRAEQPACAAKGGNRWPYNGAAKRRLPKLKGDRFDRTTQAVLAAAAECALLQGSLAIRLPHLFVTLISHGEGLLRDALHRGQVRPEQVVLAMLQLVPPRPLPSTAQSKIGVSRSVYDLLARSEKRATDEGRHLVGERDMILAMFEDRESIVATTLTKLGCEWLLDDCFDEIPVVADSLVDERRARNRVREIPDPEPASKIMPMLGLDLTAKVRGGELAKVVGRNREINTLVQTLGGNDAAHVLLVGEPSVGRQAIVEGLAQWINEGLCPESLRGKQVIEFSGHALAAQTRFAGEFERSFHALLDETGDAILFVRDMDRLILAPAVQARCIGDRQAAAGESQRRFADTVARQVLESALKAGEARLVGTATTANYEQMTALQDSLVERFRVQIIEPPTRAEAIEMVTQHKERFEREYAPTTVRDEAIEEVVALAVDADCDRVRPGRALTLLRHACILLNNEHQAHDGNLANEGILLDRETVCRLLTRLELGKSCRHSSNSP